MANVSRGNYEEDDRTFLSEFLEILEKKNTKETRTNDENNEGREDDNKENNFNIINNNINDINNNNNNYFVSNRSKSIIIQETTPTINVTIQLSSIEQNILYYIAGYILKCIVSKEKCAICVQAVGSKKSTRYIYAKLTRLKRINNSESLYFINEISFQFFLGMEQIFRNHLQRVSSDSTLNCNQYLISQFQKLPYSIPNCHNLKNKLLVRYCMLN